MYDLDYADTIHTPPLSQFNCTRLAGHAERFYNKTQERDIGLAPPVAGIEGGIPENDSMEGRSFGEAVSDLAKASSGALADHIRGKGKP